MRSSWQSSCKPKAHTLWGVGLGVSGGAAESGVCFVLLPAVPGSTFTSRALSLQIAQLKVCRVLHRFYRQYKPLQGTIQTTGHYRALRTTTGRYTACRPLLYRWPNRARRGLAHGKICQKSRSSEVTKYTLVRYCTSYPAQPQLIFQVCLSAKL